MKMRMMMKKLVIALLVFAGTASAADDLEEIRQNLMRQTPDEKLYNHAVQCTVYYEHIGSFASVLAANVVLRPDTIAEDLGYKMLLFDVDTMAARHAAVNRTEASRRGGGLDRDLKVTLDLIIVNRDLTRNEARYNFDDKEIRAQNHTWATQTCLQSDEPDDEAVKNFMGVEIKSDE